MMQPTRRPKTTEVLFMIGEPNRSQRMMVRKTENPSPRNSALPHGSGCGAALDGQNWKAPVVGLDEQVPLPPAQFIRAVSMRWTPMRHTVGPVTRGGNSFLSIRGLVKDRPISKSAQREAVPRMAPYPSGQGSLTPAAEVGQYPLAYICESPPVATGIIAKLVPTTLSNPVPR